MTFTSRRPTARNEGFSHGASRLAPGLRSYGYAAWPFGLSGDGRRVLVEDRKYERLERSQRVEISPYAGEAAPVVVARFAGSPTWNA
jgi:hypothetical protein